MYWKFAFLMLMLGVAFRTPSAEVAARDCLGTPFDNGCYAGMPAAEYQLLLDQMILQPKPDALQLDPDERELFKYAFREILHPGATTLYSDPGGAAIGVVPVGSSHATTMGYEPGWVMIRPGEWVRESETKVIQPSTFSGVVLNENSFKYPLAWVLLPDRPAPYPGAEWDTNRPRLERYTLVHIYAEVEVDGWRWYLIAPDTWIKQTSIGRVILTERPAGVKGRWFAGDLYEQVLVAYEDDTPVFATLMSSGRPQYATHEGTFQTWIRMRADAMTGAEGRDDFYSVEYVPWVLYYDQSFAIHAVYWHDKFGYRASRGCLGVSVTDARWLFEWSEEGGYELPWVHVFSSGAYVGE